MQKFVLSDGAFTNSYGFRIRTAGINLQRFLENPVMLNEHQNSTGAVLGRWANAQAEGTKLTAVAEFDAQDPAAKQIQGKVERGYIKGASVGISFDREKLKMAPDGVLELEACELYEASIVAVPANAGSLRLYAPHTGRLLTTDEVKLAVADLANSGHQTNLKPTHKTMEKLNLSAAVMVALALSSTSSTEDVSAAVERLHANYLAEKQARQELQTKLDAQAKLQAQALVDAALADGRITADAKDDFLDLAKANYALASKTLAALPAKQSLAGATGNTAAANTAGQVKSLDEFAALPLAKQLTFRAENPEKYAALFA